MRAHRAGIMAAALGVAASFPSTPHAWNGGQAVQSSGAREVRRRQRALDRGSPLEQERRITAAIAKRQRKAARRLSEALRGTA